MKICMLFICFRRKDFIRPFKKECEVAFLSCSGYDKKIEKRGGMRMSFQKEYSFHSESDGLLISVLEVVPEKAPYKGIMQLVHGMSEYKERYLPFMEYLAEHGYVSVIHDHRGHGKSVKSKDDLGYMYGGGAAALLQDMLTVNQHIKEKYPNLPVVLFGHSMGSLAVRAFAAKHDSEIDMLIVCGSPSQNPARGFGVLVAKAEKLVFGARHKSKLIEALSFGSYAAKFKEEGSRHAWVCSDAEVYQEYEKNKLCGFTFSDDGYLVLFELLKEAYDTEKWKCMKPNMPILFVAGREDPCIGNVRKFGKAVKAMRTAGYLDVRGKLYPNMRHEILNEKGKEKVYQDIVAYICRKRITA